MRISIGQILVLLIIFFLLFGDLKSAKKYLNKFFKQINNLFKR